jgi:hypothetical protein
VIAGRRRPLRSAGEISALFGGPLAAFLLIEGGVALGAALIPALLPGLVAAAVGALVTESSLVVLVLLLVARALAHAVCLPDTRGPLQDRPWSPAIRSWKWVAIRSATRRTHSSPMSLENPCGSPMTPVSEIALSPPVKRRSSTASSSGPM